MWPSDTGQRLTATFPFSEQSGLNNQDFSCLSAVKRRIFYYKWDDNKDYCVFIELINILAVI